jgi:hypothetical protein
VGDRILVVPGMGPEVRALEPGRYLLSGDPESGGLVPRAQPPCRRAALPAGEPLDGRLVPHGDQRVLEPHPDPGSFIMERKMMKGIKQRAERADRFASTGSNPPRGGLAEGGERGLRCRSALPRLSAEVHDRSCRLTMGSRSGGQWALRR